MIRLPRGPLKIEVINGQAPPTRDAKMMMEELRLRMTDTSMDPGARISMGAIVIGNWATEVREDYAETRRRLEALDGEIASMATTDDFWSAMRDVIRRDK